MILFFSSTKFSTIASGFINVLDSGYPNLKHLYFLLCLIQLNNLTLPQQLIKKTKNKPNNLCALLLTGTQRAHKGGHSVCARPSGSCLQNMATERLRPDRSRKIRRDTRGLHGVLA